MEKRIEEVLKKAFGRGIDQCTDEEIQKGLLILTKQEMAGHPAVSGKKKVYYISAEFLIGKLLSNNLINLGMYEDVKEALKKHGKELSLIEEYEPEPSLGNGGLGRLAACFLDSIATLGLPGDGVGLNYHYGLFEQKFENRLQKELKNPWITDNCWLTRTDRSFSVPFRRCTVRSSMYDIDIPGYQTEGINKNNQPETFRIIKHLRID